MDAITLIYLPWVWLTAVIWFIFTVIVNHLEFKNPHPDIRFAEWHHGYLGDMFFIIGWIFGGSAIILQIAGLILRLDDTIQHHVQLTNPEYQSILHRLYAKYLWPIPIVQQITKWLDRLFGAGS